jgi:hypothetical protein
MSDAQGPKEPHESVSRRTMLKRIGAAGAIAWATPVISSLNTPASATSFVTCGHTCVHCDSNSDLCGQAGPLGRCFCTPRADGGDCFCGEEISCASTHACGATAGCDDLGPGWICADVCGCGGGSFCIPTCGSFDAHGASVRGATTAGRTI